METEMKDCFEFVRKTYQKFRDMGIGEHPASILASTVIHAEGLKFSLNAQSALDAIRDTKGLANQLLEQIMNDPEIKPFMEAIANQNDAGCAKR